MRELRQRHPILLAFSSGIRFYLIGHVFIRSEAQLYLIRHNFAFSSARAVRFGGFISYMLGPQE